MRRLCYDFVFVSQRKPKPPLRARHSTAPAGAPPKVQVWRAWVPFALLALLVLVFYWEPLTSASATIQWDAVDVHYSSQKYFADHIRSGKLPFWTPYLYSGFPFLADPQVGAWYPLNWPFFLFGITPKAIELELALHALIAAAGAYVLARRLLDSRWPALAAALLYGFSGFFAAHSSHIGMFQGAAWLPWALAALLCAIEENRRFLAILAGGAVALMGLAGHFQTTLYGAAALGLAAAAAAAHQPKVWRRAAVLLLVAFAVAVLVASVVIVPGLELAAQSIRAHADASTNREGSLPVAALGTLLNPNLYGAVTGKYTGPADITQYYYYAGILLLPLAAFGLKDRRVRVLAVTLLVPAVWYALGPAAGLYRVIALLPGFKSIRGPVHVWFIAALALALLASAGLKALASRFRWQYVTPVVLAFLFADAFYWNSAVNAMAYARTSFDQAYGATEQLLAKVAQEQPALTRFHAPSQLAALGPMNGPLDVKLEATYGYNPLQLQSYANYMERSVANPKLLDALGVARRLNMQTGGVDANAGALPRAYFPRRLERVASEAEARSRLQTLQPPNEAVVTEIPPGTVQDPAARADIVAHDESGMRIRCQAASPSLLRIAVPFFPGWHASAAGKTLPLVRADHALIGVIVPAGASEVELQFRSNYFLAGAVFSLLGLAVVIGSFVFARRLTALG